MSPTGLTPDGKKRQVGLEQAVKNGWISSPADSHASRSASLDADAAPTTSAGYGPSSAESFAYYDRDMCSSKMCREFSPTPPSKVREIDVYAAGLIDGEGCIYIAQDKRKDWMYPRVDVGMTEKATDLLARLSREFGGTVRMTRKATGRWEAAMCWTLTGPKAISLLRRVSPYLRLKTEQARLALAVDELRQSLPKHRNGTAAWTPEARQQARVIRELIQNLNRKGPSVTPEAGWFARVVADQWISAQGDLFSPAGLQPYSVTWPRSGTTRNGHAYQRPPLVRLTSDGESSSWPTPSATMGDYSRGGDPERYKGSKSLNGRRSNLIDAVARWPTPTSGDSKMSGAAGYSTESGRHSGTTLTDAVNGGALNPTWVEWLMGFPLGWTDLGDSATRSSRKSRKRSAG